MKKKRKVVARKELSAIDWRDIYDALMDAASVHHSGPRADRYVELARKIREQVMA
jgi:hypothetical protein